MHATFRLHKDLPIW